ncbi:MAG: aminotransferase class V-fold PLP-dependent enzyme [Acidobacteria bacterium]|nr:aminotransferase class V-fold PLP-dependent enzyme [Acidobacteriota bacterium]
MRSHSKNIQTQAVHAGDRKKLADYTPVTTPIFAASTYFYEKAEDLEAVFNNERPGHSYSRYGNPTTSAFEEQVATLEGADFAVATSSGMAAAHLALLAGVSDRRRKIVAASVLYGQTMSMLMKVFEPLGVETRFADVSDLEGFEAAVAEEKPGVVLVETISNPLLRVAEIDRLAEIAHRHGALLLVDATFTTPVMMRPLELGADLVIHSSTKYMGGHGDVLSGVVAGRAELQPTITYLSKTLGATLGAFEAFLTMRGVKTLPLRFERQCANALGLAEALATNADVERVYFPGRPDHPDAAIARRLFPEGMYGAVVSFDLEGGRERALAFLDALRMAAPATSVGDLHTMALYPAMSSHRDLSPKHRQRLGIGDGMLRLSVGVEALEDIVADVEQAVAVSAHKAAAPLAGD